MKNFSVKLLKPQQAILSGQAEDVSIIILLHAFVLDDELIATSLRLDSINLPSVRLAELVSKSFDFPLNPKDAYIDGSIYLGHRHYPVDVERLEFHANRHGGASLLLRGAYVFEQEAWGDTKFIYSVPISSGVV